VLADEPTANLDHATGEGILDLMKQINERYKTTFIFSTHDKKVMSKADRLVWLEDGQVRMLGVRTPQKWMIVDQRRRSAATEATEAEQK
jgi:putative ABC transport system ATP-binding protein